MLQQRFRGLTLAMLVAALALIAGVPMATGVHDDDLFQLDYVTSPVAQGAANVSSTNISPPGNIGDDWDEVYAGTSDAFATAFIPDPVGDAETSFYTGGGSKDERPISTGRQHWEWDDTNDVIPDKDDLSHAFAAAYEDPDSGHTIFYFGADRFDTSGDAEVGFWFFREPVTLGTKPDFNGEHEVGDILVLANWGGSNKVGDIKVYEWIGGQNPLQLLKDTTEADCSVAPADDPVCAVVNNIGGETPPWSYTNKDGQTSYQPSALFEGGIDVNDLLDVEEIGCFSSFLAATRSSHSTDAQLKDFALGAFPVCGVDVTKTGDELSKIGDPVNYTITVENTGQATLYKRNISDTLLGAITTNGVNQANPYVLTNTCGASLAPGATCTITLQRTVQAGDPDPLPNTVDILYSEHADFTGLEFMDEDDHEVNLFQPAVMIEKTGDELSKATDAVTYTFTITNMSSEDSPNLTLASISDNVIGDLATQATAAGCDVLTFEEECSFSVTRTVSGTDPDPLVNTVDVLYHPVGFPNDITASDGHSVNLFQPSVSITKDGDELSKIGDDVTYHVKITNTSSGDSPNLVLDSISDDVLGDLSDEAPAACDSIDPGASCEFDVPWTVTAVDVNPADGQADDPVINTVTIHFHPDGFPNDITATASHELNLFQPSIAFEKTADTELSKVGDDVNYTLTLNNTSSVDTPDLECTVTDATLGVNKQVTLASGEGDVTNVAYTVQAGDPDPLVNSASVSCSPTGFPNVLTASDSWTVNLFQPSVEIDKTGDTLSKVGDDVTYHFEITNTSSADSPNLMLDSLFDDVLGSLTAPASCDNLAPGASCEFDVPWTVLAGFGDPVVNTVEVHYHPVGFPNDINDTDSHSLNLFQPSIAFSKSADTELSKVGDDVNYTLALSNTSSADTPDLACTVTDALLGVNKQVTLASGEGDVTNVAYTVQAGDPDPLINTASVSCSPTGFPNVLTASDSWTVDLFQPSVKITKGGDTLSKVGDDVTYTFEIENTSSSDSPNLILDSISDSVLGDLADEAPAGCDSLAPGATCSFNVVYTVQAGDPDPLENTVTVHYHPDGFPNDITDSDDHEVNLFQPAVTVDKSGDTLSKVGDAVTYTFTITNSGSADSPDLILDSVVDSVIGDLTATADIAGCGSLAAGASCNFTFTRIVKATDPDPLENTVTVHYHPDGFPNDITDSDSHSVNLFQPSITFDKTGDGLSKVGDDVKYTLTLNNTSSADSPDLDCTITDTMLGIDKDVTLASGASDVIEKSYTVQPGDSDPLVNTADVTCSPQGFPNVLLASDSHSVNLFQPSLKVKKEAGNPYSKAGDPVDYKVTIENTSSADSPDLIIEKIDDSLQGDLTNAANYDSSTCGASLASGASCVIEYTRTVAGGDPDPLENTVSVETHPDGFPNDVDASSSVSVDLLHPAYTVTKDCKAGTEPVPQEGPALFTIVITNTGDADLVITADDGIGTVNLAAGASQSFQHSIAGPFTGQSTVENTVHTTAVLDAKYGLPNTYAKDATGDCRVGGRVNVVKTTQGGSAPVGGWTFKLYSGPDGFDSGTLLATDNTPPDTLDFGNLNLDPTKTYTVCEENVPAGWTSLWKVDTDGDGIADTIINPYNPNADDNPAQDLGNRCIDFGAGTDFPIPAGGTLVFQVDNSFPGGEPRTPGYWKNWSSCTGGNQYANAIAKGGGPAGFWTLDELLNNPGFTIGLMVLNGVWNDDPYKFQNAPLNNDCVEAVRILDKSDAKDGKKRASDAAYELATALLAARLNFAAGAETCQAAQDAAIAGQALLVSINFTGTGSYLPSNVKNGLAVKRAQALALATTLDQYNNGNLC